MLEGPPAGTTALNARDMNVKSSINTIEILPPLAARGIPRFALGTDGEGAINAWPAPKLVIINPTRSPLPFSNSEAVELIETTLSISLMGPPNSFSTYCLAAPYEKSCFDILLFLLMRSLLCGFTVLARSFGAVIIQWKMTGPRTTA